MSALKITQTRAGAILTVTFAGQIDENADYEAISFAGISETRFDLAGIRLINSTGIQRWMRFLEAIPADVRIIFARCSVRVVNQINMFSDFTAGRPVEISSFFAPYYSETHDKTVEVLLETSVHFKGEIKAPVMRFDTDNSELEFDGIEKKFFAFLKHSA